MFFKINKCIFIGVRMKAFTIQSKKEIGAWAHMRPPPLWKQKCVLDAVAFLWNFFDFPIFSIYRKLEFSIFPQIVSATTFGLITHIIKLFQTVQIQKANFKIC